MVVAYLLSAPPLAEADPASWLDRVVAEGTRHLGSTVCLGGLEATGCRHRLITLLDASADFDALAASVLRGLDAPEAPEERARFREALRGVLVRTWERRLQGSARVGVRVLDVALNRATVRLTRGRDSIDVALTLVSAADGPRIANVGIDGADVVGTWRPRVAQLLREGTWDTMIFALQAR
ncbi:MAG: hypothetical protein AMXMBFR64_55090 [Myxococcales bacterium]